MGFVENLVLSPVVKEEVLYGFCWKFSSLSSGERV